MIRNVSMLILSLVVVGVMAAALFLFFKRLDKIEEEQWGPKKKK